MGYTPPWWNATKVAGGWSVNMPGVTTDDLTITANDIDANSAIKLFGGGAMQLNFNSGSALNICYDTFIALLNIIYTANGPDVSPAATNKDLIFTPTGTGRVRFGTYAAGAATDSTGYIEIKDNGGTTRKLMVQA